VTIWRQQPGSERMERMLVGLDKAFAEGFT